MGFPGGASGKEAAYQCRRPWVGKILWRRAWQPLQYSCLENPMDRGAWQATYSLQSLKESDTTEQLSKAHSIEDTNERSC